jgi:DNA-binding CsgD family transcriptional regulator
MGRKNRNLSYDDYISIVEFTKRCWHCGSQSEAEDIFNDLKELIPFDYYSIGTVYVEDRQLHSVESLRWYTELKGFEEFYISNRLYKIDPVAIEGLDQVNNKRIAVQFWRNTYRKHFNPEFFSQIEPFGMYNLDGYTHLYKINPVSFTTFSCAGPDIPSRPNRRIAEILTRVIAPISILAQNTKLGIFSRLTDEQYEIYQLMKTSMTYGQIASKLNTSRSTVEKCFLTIKEIIGLESRSHISFGAKSFI